MAYSQCFTWVSIYLCFVKPLVKLMVTKGQVSKGLQDLALISVTGVHPLVQMLVSLLQPHPDSGGTGKGRAVGNFFWVRICKDG